MTELIRVPQPQYLEMVAYIENCIRNKFDSTPQDEWWTFDSLIKQAEELGCTLEFINQLKKDLLC